MGADERVGCCVWCAWLLCAVCGVRGVRERCVCTVCLSVCALPVRSSFSSAGLTNLTLLVATCSVWALTDVQLDQTTNLTCC
jgi:hypothetical protein